MEPSVPSLPRLQGPCLARRKGVQERQGAKQKQILWGLRKEKEERKMGEKRARGHGFHKGGEGGPGQDAARSWGAHRTCLRVNVAQG